MLLLLSGRDACFWNSLLRTVNGGRNALLLAVERGQQAHSLILLFFSSGGSARAQLPRSFGTTPSVAELSWRQDMPWPNPMNLLLGTKPAAKYGRTEQMQFRLCLQCLSPGLGFRV